MATLVATRGRAIAVFSLLIAGFPAAVGAQLVVPERDSAVYYRHLAVAGEAISVDRGGLLAGDLHSNGDVRLGRDTLLLGKVRAVGRVPEARRIGGQVEEGADPLELPEPISEATARAMAGEVFEGDTLFEDDLVLDGVVFVAGNVDVVGRLGGQGTIIATGDIRVTPLAGGEAAPADTLSRLSLVAFRDIRVGSGRAVRGVLYAGGDIHLGSSVKHRGVLVARGGLHVGSHPGLVFEDFDTRPPEIALLAPSGERVVNRASPRLASSFKDDFSGVDPTTFTISLDGVDRTAEAAVNSNGFSMIPFVKLAQGLHLAEVSVADNSGKWARASWVFTVDSERPVIAVETPDATLGEDGTGRVEVAYRDTASGVDLPSVSVSVDGVDITPACEVGSGSATCVVRARDRQALAIKARVFDRAGNAATEHVQLAVRCSPGAGSGECGLQTRAAGLAAGPAAPAGGAGGLETGRVGAEQPEVGGPPGATIRAPKDGSLLASRWVTVTGSAGAGPARLWVDGQPPVAVSGSFSVEVELAEGVNTLRLETSDRDGERSVAAVTVIRDTVAPVITLDSPAPVENTNRRAVTVSGRVEDPNGIASLEIGGAPVAVRQGRFEETVSLVEGLNVLVTRAVDSAGNAAESHAEVRRFTVPTVVIDQPQDLAVVAGERVDVSGTVSDAAATVTVNGVRATVRGGVFFAAGVRLGPGRTLINAVTTLRDGHAASDSIAVLRDTEPPRVHIDFPADGATLFGDTTTVTGLVNDIVLGTVGAAQATVTVNGIEAEVHNRSFRALGVPVDLGGNELVAVSVDAAGNTSRARVNVRREPEAAPRVEIIAGNDQTGTTSSELDSPLEVVLLDAVGMPMPGRDVIFAVKGNDGVLGDGARRVVITTGRDGRAATTLRLGSRAGVQLVEASAVGFGGPAVFTQVALAGAPAVLLLDSGDRQIGVAGQPLPRPLVAVLTDAGLNRVEGGSVTFRVIRGGGRFENDLAQISVPSDHDGRAAVSLILGPAEGDSNNIVEARSSSGAPVVFTASGLVAGNAENTAVSGVVLDPAGRPLRGVMLTIAGTGLRARTDASGSFSIEGAPLGAVVLEVDPEGALQRVGRPALELTLFNVPGRDNRLERPIYLTTIDAPAERSRSAGEGAGPLEVAALPGFWLEITPGAARFADGSIVPDVMAALVPNDRTPPVAGFARPPRGIVAIQPSTARFDPPAPVVFPNLEGLPPGRTTELHAYVADLGRFVAIGPATVSQDGLLIVSEPGVGVVSGGWLTVGDPRADHAPAAAETRASTTRLDLLARKTQLRAAGGTLRLRVTGTLADGSRVDLSDAASGTDYRSSNPAIASVDPSGLVTAKSSGALLVSALNDGVLAVLPLRVVLPGDSDSDGLPDDVEMDRGLDPNDPLDARLDPVGNGLSNLDESLAGF